MPNLGTYRFSYSKTNEFGTLCLWNFLIFIDYGLLASLHLHSKTLK